MGMSLGARLRETRTKNQMSRKELARASGVSEKSIANYETNRTTPDRDRMLAIAAALDVPLSTITGRKPRTDTTLQPAAGQSAAEEQSTPEMKTEPEQPIEPLYEIVNRLCSGSKCDDCIVGRDRAETERLCTIIARGVDVEAVIVAIRQWGADNPPPRRPTYRSDFFEKLPDAPRREDGAPVALVEHVYGRVDDSRRPEFLTLTHRERWNKPFGYWSECAG